MRAAVPFLVAAFASSAAFIAGALAYEGGVSPIFIVPAIVLYGGGWILVARDYQKARRKP